MSSNPNIVNRSDQLPETIEESDNPFPEPNDSEQRNEIMNDGEHEVDTETIPRDDGTTD